MYIGECIGRHKVPWLSLPWKINEAHVISLTVVDGTDWAHQGIREEYEKGVLIWEKRSK